MFALLRTITPVIGSAPKSPEIELLLHRIHGDRGEE
jgi:hypothetical protein